MTSAIISKKDTKMVLTREVTEEIKSAVNAAVNKCLKEQSFIKTICDNVSIAVSKAMEQKLIQIEQKVVNLQAEFSQMKTDMESKINRMDTEITELLQEKNIIERKCDILEQATKMNNLRIFKVPEKNKENLKDEIIDLLNTKMSIALNENDVTVCYRIGKKEGNKARGIFLQLKNHELRQEIYRRKKFMKGTGIVIREDLTRLRVELLTKTIEKTSIKNVWTDLGNILVNHHNKLYIIKSKNDYDKIFG